MTATESMTVRSSEQHSSRRHLSVSPWSTVTSRRKRSPPKRLSSLPWLNRGGNALPRVNLATCLTTWPYYVTEIHQRPKDVAPSLVPPRALAATCDDVEQDPRSYREAMRGPHAREWRHECENEIDQQRKMGTWRLVPRPKQRVNIVDNRWVLHLTYNVQGELIKRRARLVAKGYSQRPGVDYFETYSPVVRYPSLRGLLSLAAQHDWEVHHMDVKAAYLNGDLQETVYMRQPEGFEVQGKEDWVCLLEKGLYGLKQAGRVWNQKADKFLRRLGFTPLDADRCVYVWKRESRMVVVALYVDDMFLFVPRGSSLLAKLKARLQQKFEMTDLGEVNEGAGSGDRTRSQSSHSDHHSVTPCTRHPGTVTCGYDGLRACNYALGRRHSAVSA